MFAGDIVEVATGAKVPADLRVLEVTSSILRVDQSILTGESGSVEKVAHDIQAPSNAVYQDKINLLFSGTIVTAGRSAHAVTIVAVQYISQKHHS